jgi:hypothetical protein
MEYTVLSLAGIQNALEEIARDAREQFGRLDAQQLNWRSDQTRWSVGQCFEHLLTTNRLIVRHADEALDRGRPQTIWQRLPVLPGVWGRMLIRSQSPSDARNFKAPPAAQPSPGSVAADVLTRFIQQQRESAAWIQTMDERAAAGAIMTSPFFDFITYSVPDGCRLMVAHNRRHFEQARRVTRSSGFPGSA